MCAIVDNDVRDEVFGGAESPAGKLMLDWLTGPGRLVVGGKLRAELAGSQAFTTWLRTASRFGRVINVSDAEVDAETDALDQQQVCRSNDTHVLALARKSKARLLFTNDRKLQQDFDDPKIVARPRGIVYTTRNGPAVTKVHRDILSRKDICAAPRSTATKSRLKP